jgi:hypothetical protein
MGGFPSMKRTHHGSHSSRNCRKTWPVIVLGKLRLWQDVISWLCSATGSRCGQPGEATLLLYASSTAAASDGSRSQATSYLLMGLIGLLSEIWSTERSRGVWSDLED